MILFLLFTLSPQSAFSILIMRQNRTENRKPEPVETEPAKPVNGTEPVKTGTGPWPPVAARGRPSPPVAARRRPWPPVAARRRPSPPVAARRRPWPPVAARGR